jgi:hypothetical protein
MTIPKGWLDAGLERAVARKIASDAVLSWRKRALERMREAS